MDQDENLSSQEEDVQGQLMDGLADHARGQIAQNTLDEPVVETLKRDIRAIGDRFKYVFLRRDRKSLLKNWDLYGPLLICTVMAWFLEGEPVHVNGKRIGGGPEFAEVFVLVGIGALVVTANSHMLGGALSYFQSVCVLGYCLLPLGVALIFCKMILFFPQDTGSLMLRLLSTGIGFFFAVVGAINFIGDSIPPNKKALAIYPVFLFYFIVAWLVVSDN